MEEQHRAHGLRGLKEGQELRLVPGLAVDHRVQFRALEAQGVDRPVQLGDGGRHVLHGQGSVAGEAAGGFADVLGDVFVDLFGLGQAVGGREVVAESRGVDGDHLHLGADVIHVGHPLFGSEAALGVDAHHLAFPDADRVAVVVGVPHTVPFPAGVQGGEHGLGKGVGVDVNAAHGRTSSDGYGAVGSGFGFRLAPE